MNRPKLALGWVSLALLLPACAGSGTLAGGGIERESPRPPDTTAVGEADGPSVLERILAVSPDWCPEGGPWEPGQCE